MKDDLLAGLAARDMALDTHEYTYKNWLGEARNAAYNYAKTNSGFVSSDDVHRLTPMPPWIHHNAMGAVFRDKRFIAIGFIQTRRKQGHARWIHEYGLA